VISALLRVVFGRECPTHGISYRSDFCPQCLRARIVRDGVIDSRREWVKSEGSWPLQRDETTTRLRLIRESGEESPTEVSSP
jgi:hypothetical protein